MNFKCHSHCQAERQPLAPDGIRLRLQPGDAGVSPCFLILLFKPLRAAGARQPSAGLPGLPVGSRQVGPPGSLGQLWGGWCKSGSKCFQGSGSSRGCLRHQAPRHPPGGRVLWHGFPSLKVQGRDRPKDTQCVHTSQQGRAGCGGRGGARAAGSLAEVPWAAPRPGTWSWSALGPQGWPVTPGPALLRRQAEIQEFCEPRSISGGKQDR